MLNCIFRVSSEADVSAEVIDVSGDDIDVPSNMISLTVELTERFNVRVDVDAMDNVKTLQFTIESITQFPSPVKILVLFKLSDCITKKAFCRKLSRDYYLPTRHFINRDSLKIYLFHLSST